jgi:[acyl-carrier-protein] S-malonyltransferase
MGRQLAEELPVARDLFSRADVILGYSLSDLCFAGPAEKLDSTEFSQPALFVCSLAALEKLKSESPELVADCPFTAGLSLGEYTALVFAEALTFEDGLKLVQERGRAMQQAAEATPSTMYSILGLELEQVFAVCEECRLPREVLQIANLLCPGNIVISGHVKSCEAAAAKAQELGAMRCIKLAVAGAFHTSLMEPAKQRLEQAVSRVQLNPPRRKILSNVDGLQHNSPDEIRQLLVRQLVSPVLWEKSMRELMRTGCDVFYEVGPGKVLRGLLKRIDRKANTFGVLDQ